MSRDNEREKRKPSFSINMSGESEDSEEDPFADEDDEDVENFVREMERHMEPSTGNSPRGNRNSQRNTTTTTSNSPRSTIERMNRTMAMRNRTGRPIPMPQGMTSIPRGLLTQRLADMASRMNIPPRLASLMRAPRPGIAARAAPTINTTTTNTTDHKRKLEDSSSPEKQSTKRPKKEEKEEETFDKEKDNEQMIKYARDGHLDGVRQLITSGRADPKTARCSTTAQTALMVALKKQNNTRVVAYLIEMGSDVTATDHQGKTPLHYAATIGSAECARMLIRNGALPNFRANQWAPIHVAVQLNHVDVVKALLEGHALVNLKGAFGWSPIQLACQGGFTELAKVLIENSADVNHIDQYVVFERLCSSFRYCI